MATTHHHNNSYSFQKLNKQSMLKPQLHTDIPHLTTSSPHVISRQATINIGVVGHVSHGKSTIVQGITGTNPARHRDQILENRTKRLGYANAKIYKCCQCPQPECYQAYPSYKQDNPLCNNSGCLEKLQLIRHVSFCDCPGHDAFMSTMLTGAAIIDAALLLVAANVDCPQPQTAQHLSALQMMQIKDIIIIQNKIDLVFHDKDRLKLNYKQIKQFMKDSVCKNAPLIPICAQLKYNIDALLQAICELPIPIRKLNVSPLMVIIRSFDVNKPGTDFENLKGGVVGGTIIQGILQVGMQIQIRPGYVSKDQDGKIKCTPIHTVIQSLEAEKNSLLYAIPGGLIGVCLPIDPSITRNDKMIGNLLGAKGTLPDIFTSINVKFYLMKNLLGASKQNEHEGINKVKKVMAQQILKINVKSCQTIGRVIKIIDDIMVLQLGHHPICSAIGSKISFSRRFGKKFRLIGYGQLKGGQVYRQL